MTRRLRVDSEGNYIPTELTLAGQSCENTNLDDRCHFPGVTKMKRLILLGSVFMMGLPCAFSEPQTDDVFSGPQVGETLPGFEMKVSLGGEPGTSVNFVKDVADDPIVVVFVHQLTRPAFALANAVMKYCGDVSQDRQIARGICFLSQDPTKAQTQIDRAKKYFPKKTLVGYSTEGIEGPGSYGLNRNVQVTILVAKEKSVVANFALVQPGVHADGPKVLAAIAKTIDAKDKPDINDYLPNNQAAQDAPIAIDPALMVEIRKLNSKDVDESTLKASITKLDELTKDKKGLQQQLASVANRWVRGGRFDEIATKEQQATIKRWAQRMAPSRGQRMNRPQRDEKLTGLLRNLIQKTNTDAQVDQAVKEIETYISSSESGKAELKRITTTVVNGGKLENYGTSYCQSKLKAWAERFKSDK